MGTTAFEYEPAAARAGSIAADGHARFCLGGLAEGEVGVDFVEFNLFRCG